MKFFELTDVNGNQAFINVAHILSITELRNTTEIKLVNEQIFIVGVESKKIIIDILDATILQVYS